MEFLLVSLFFISIRIFFIAGKDDFGRRENKLITKEIGETKKEETKKEETKKEETKKEETKKEEETKPN